MTDKQVALARARADAALARERLSMTTAVVQARLSPRSLVREVGDKVTDGAREGVSAAKRHPRVVAGSLAAAALLLARRPIARLLRRRDETPAPVPSLMKKRIAKTKDHQ